MSGGVGPISDISLPQEQSHEPEITNTALKNKPTATTHRSFFTFKQLNVLAVATVLSASGLVSIEDFTFVVFSIIYMYLFSKTAFPQNTAETTSPVFKNKFLTLYVTIGAIIGLILPIGYIFEGIMERDKEGIKAAAPHVFLLASQFFMEELFSVNFSQPVQVFVPVLYNARRILAIMEWVTIEVYKDHGRNEMRLYVGRVIAFTNMVFWSFNLFGFLLPFCLPKAFKAYYEKVKD